MTVQRQDLEAAAAAGLLPAANIDALLAFMAGRSASRPSSPRFSGIHVLYYLGGLLSIGAASLFATLAVEALGMPALLGLSALYGLCIYLMAAWLQKRDLAVPASMLATLFIALVPMMVFALQQMLGVWEEGGNARHYRDFHLWIDWRWLVMELATLGAGVAMIRRFPYPFLVLPMAVVLWYMGMDIVPALILQGSDDSGWFTGSSWELRKMVSMIFGLLMLAGALLIDLRTRQQRDFAFWIYLFGLLTFCGSLAMMGNGGLAGKLGFLAIHFALVLIGAILGRRTFAVFGGIGIMAVLGDLSWNLFEDSFAFVVVLTLLGFALIGTGIWWSRHEAALAGRLRAVLPSALQGLLNARD